MSSVEPEYLSILKQYYDEEVSGEAFYKGLSKYFDDPKELEKISYLAKVEKHAASTVRPLLDKYKITPQSDTELYVIGKNQARQYSRYDWHSLMKEISTNFPNYIGEFIALENMAPTTDQTILRKLTAHEIAVIEFANLELENCPRKLTAAFRLFKRIVLPLDLLFKEYAIVFCRIIFINYTI